jgi:predicted small metal-binding protein
MSNRKYNKSYCNIQMSQAYENCIQLFCVRCEDVGLHCNCIIYGISEEVVTYNTILHMLEYHAIKPEEMTSCMKLKILENIHVHHPPPPENQLAYNSHF